MEAVTPRPTVEELKALRVVDLRQRLAQVGLPQSGVKAELIDRLDRFYTNRDNQQQQQQQQQQVQLHQQQYEDQQQQIQQQQLMLSPNRVEHQHHQVGVSPSYVDPSSLILQHQQHQLVLEQQQQQHHHHQQQQQHQQLLLQQQQQQQQHQLLLQQHQLRLEEEARKRLIEEEQQARLQQQIEQQRILEEARLREAQELQLRVELAKQQEEHRMEEARLRALAEEQAKARELAEEEARRQASILEAQQQQRAYQEQLIQQRAVQEELARKVAEEVEARRVAEEEAIRMAAAEEAQRAAAAEMEALRLAAEEEARRVAAAEEEALRMAAAEEEAQRVAAAEEEARRVAAAEEEARQVAAAEEEARRMAAAEEEARRVAAAEEEARRVAAAEEEARRVAVAEEEALRRVAAEEEARRAAVAEEEALRRAAAEEEARQVAVAEEEARRVAAAEDEARRMAAAEEESRRVAAAEEEALRMAAAEEEALRMAAAEEEARQLAAAEEEARRVAAAEEEALIAAAQFEARMKEGSMVAFAEDVGRSSFSGNGTADTSKSQAADATEPKPRKLFNVSIASMAQKLPQLPVGPAATLEEELDCPSAKDRIQHISNKEKAEPVSPQPSADKIQARVAPHHHLAESSSIPAYTEDLKTEKDDGYDDDDDGENFIDEGHESLTDSNMNNNRKQQKKKGKKNKKKKNRPEEWARQKLEADRRKQEDEERARKAKDEPEVKIEYVQETLDIDLFANPVYRAFTKVFEAFKIDEDEEGRLDAKAGDGSDLRGARDSSELSREELKKVPKLLEKDDLLEDEDGGDGDEAGGVDGDREKLSKRKLKKLNRLSVAELKQLVSRPDVVEMHDVTAKDPGLLVTLKATRNTVPVPRHWCFKRKYLQGKRGIEKPPFDLPDFIKRTGIMEMRAALQEKEAEKNLKAKMREKVRPKLGKIDIDYQKLHDAFFKWQTKPRMTSHGDLYYEGKEFEIRLKEKKPGDLSDDLRTALGMPVGPNAHKVPPPWLIAMQRYGPPPSYPNLKIPGLNAPIPESCSFGYHAGGWGKPPVDETGKPLYGDVFGTSDSAFNQQSQLDEVDTSLWGEMESESEEEESEDEDEDEDEEDADAADQAAGAQTPLADAGLATPSGMSSVGLGQETPEVLDIRKKKIEAEMEGGETPNLFTVLPERRNERIGSSMMGSQHTYDLGAAGIGGGGGGRRTGGAMDPGTSAVELALNPEEVDLMDTEAMTARAEAALREQQAMLAKEDLSDMVAEHAAKQSSKRKRMAAKEETKSAKKYKEFKF